LWDIDMMCEGLRLVEASIGYVFHIRQCHLKLQTRDQSFGTSMFPPPQCLSLRYQQQHFRDTSYHDYHGAQLLQGQQLSVRLKRGAIGLLTLPDAAETFQSRQHFSSNAYDNGKRPHHNSRRAR